MKTQTKVHLDRRLGVPLARVLNVLARIVGEILRRDHGIRDENVRTVVFAKYVGMGSIVQATALIRSIKARFPRVRIIFLTSRSCGRLVERLEHIDTIVTVDDRNAFRLAWSSLRAMLILIRQRVDLFFDLEVYSAYSSIMALLSLARNRLGFYRKSAEHKLGNYTHLVYFNPRCHIRYIYLQLAHTVGAEPIEPDRLGPILVTDDDRTKLKEKLDALGIEKGRYLVVTPNADLMSERRRWPSDRFAALIGQLLDRVDLPVVFTGLAGAEGAYVASIVGQITGPAAGRVHNLAGKLTLGELLALLEQARCAITIDTGPMHMAWALGTPTVSLFGPGDPAHYAWTGPGVEILYERVYCSPCLYETDEPPCAGNNICMQRITVESVLAAVLRVMSAPPPNRLPSLDAKFYLDAQGRPLGRVIRASIEGSMS